MAITPTDFSFAQELTGASYTSVGAQHLVIDANSVDASFFTNVKSDGGDIRVCENSDGTNQLPIDVQLINTGSGLLTVWVRRTSYTPSSRNIFIFCGDATKSQPAAGASFGSQEVWQDFDLVIHQGTAEDATGAHTVNLIGSPSLTSNLWGGQGYDLDAVGKYLTVDHASTLNVQRDYSLDVWANTTNDGSTNVLFEKSNGNTSGFRFFELSGGNTRTRHPNLSSANLDSSTFTFGQQLFGSNMNGTTRQNWLNGSLETSDTPSGSVTNNTADVYIGTFDDVVDLLGGVLGALFLSIPNRSPNRALEYANQSNPGTFWTQGTAYDPSAGIIEVTDTTTNVNISSNNETVTLLGTITVSDSAANINITSIDESVSIVGNINVDDTLVNVDITSLNDLVTPASIVSVNDSLIDISISSINETVTINESVNVTDSIVNISISSNNETVQALGTITVSDTVSNVNITSFNDTVILSTPVSVSDSVANINISSLNESVLLAGQVNISDSVANIDITVYRPTIVIGDVTVTPSTYTITFKEDGYTIEFSTSTSTLSGDYVLRLSGASDSFSVEKAIPYLFTINRADTTIENYAADATGAVAESISWIVTDDNQPLFTSDNILLEFADE